MSDPVVEPADLGVAMNDSAINVDRAMAVIADAQTLCESVISPLPAGAAVVVKRIAKRAYMDQGRQMPSVIPGIGVQTSGGGSTMGDVWLSRADKADLRRMAGGSTAYSINLLPSDYAAVVPPWDVNVVDPVIQ